MCLILFTFRGVMFTDKQIIKLAQSIKKAKEKQIGWVGPQIYFI